MPCRPIHASIARSRGVTRTPLRTINPPSFLSLQCSVPKPDVPEEPMSNQPNRLLLNWLSLHTHHPMDPHPINTKWGAGPSGGHLTTKKLQSLQGGGRCKVPRQGVHSPDSIPQSSDHPSAPAAEALPASRNRQSRTTRRVLASATGPPLTRSSPQTSLTELLAGSAATRRREGRRHRARRSPHP
jgi:hypothetical protein